ncbi:MAG: type II toxin-antitoxin system RelB/DinJ family antitoxin [Legionellales bacterium]|nr:type II toxin-antitoxin system RelB/DinJ family antitoxin [Legionellales bacterium]
MSKSTFVRIRMDRDLKEQAEHALSELGITPTHAVTMLYKYLAHQREWPVELKVPNAVTHQTFAETDKGIGLIQANNIQDMFDKLGI